MIQANITFKSLLQPIKNIEKRNTAFANLTREGKRLEIAWEALQLLLKGTIIPAGVSGKSYYWDPTLTKTLKSSYSSKTLQEKFLKVQECRVCARGAITLSKIRLGNNTAPENLYTISIAMGNRNNSADGFSRGSLHYMENQYEASFYLPTLKPRSTPNLANILCNILVNGDYKPSDKKIYITY
jgi:hypothetical protein